jgi:hypothetical protein
MSSMREHLQNFHAKESEHHAAKAAYHATAAELHSRLADCMGKSTTTEPAKAAQAHLDALAAMHKEQAKQHSDMADWNAECADKCSKATDAADLEKLIPTRVSSIAPAQPTNLRAIPRYGAKEMPAAAISPELSKILGTGEEDLHSEERSLA